MNQTEYYNPYYYLNYYQLFYLEIASYFQIWTNRIVSPVAILFGIPANILVILVFSLYDCGVSQSAKFYYVFVAVMDLIALVNFHTFQYIGFMFPVTWSTILLPLNDVWFCKFSRWLWLSALQSSAFAMSVFCIERLYVISNPMKARGSSFSRDSMVATMLIGAVSFVSNVYLIVGYTVSPTRQAPYKVCGINGPGFTTIASYASIIYEMIPTTAELFCNLALALKISQISKERRSLSVSNKQASSNKETSAAVALITVACIRVVVFIPDSIFWAISGFVDDTDASAVMQANFFSAGTTTTLICGLVESVNFIVYYALIKKFSVQLKALLRCQKASE